MTTGTRGQCDRWTCRAPLTPRQIQRGTRFCGKRCANLAIQANPAVRARMTQALQVGVATSRARHLARVRIEIIEACRAIVQRRHRLPLADVIRIVIRMRARDYKRGWQACEARHQRRYLGQSVAGQRAGVDDGVRPD